MYTNKIEQFLKHGRGWFPFKLPTALHHKTNLGAGLNLAKNVLRVMSYNILANSLVKNTDYGDLNKEYLKWETRFPEIKRELQYFTPHILCF